LPERGLLTVACLVLIALSCISVVRTLERERRLIKKLRAQGGSPLLLRDLTDDERDCAKSLEKAGVLTIRQNECYVRSAELPVFKRKRVRLALSGGVIAFILAVLVAVLILHR
jgi:hypothetical protein